MNEISTPALFPSNSGSGSGEYSENGKGFPMYLSNEHPTEDQIEQYLFGSVAELQAEALEEHLLVCHACIDIAEGLAVFVDSMRSTLERNAPKVRVAGRPI
jgi:hypothetical protein